MSEQLTLEVPWMLELKQQAHSDLLRLGLPTRRDEDWKYTPTKALLEHQFELNTVDSGLTLKHIPDGVLVLPIKEAIRSHAELIKPYLGQIMEQTHGFHAQNMALFEAGFLIYIPEGIQASEPLHLVHTPTQSGKMQCFRHLLVADTRSSLQVIETYESNLDTPYFTNTMTEVMVGSHAEISHLKIQREGPSAFHVGEVAVKQAANSRFESHSLSLGASLARSDTTVEFSESHASCLMNGIYMPNDTQHIDHHTTVKHAVPDCVSEQDYKGILKGRARAVFNGKVLVFPDASKTEAKQYNKNVLLSSEAEVDTKPELQIFTDDVVCAHGATVGQLDEEALFYLATRGIDAELAHQYLMRAFLADNLRQMVASGLDNQLNELITQHME
ncbi:MAG: Fe-S cluster assembly protein SufD [Gammaproteobacteria bacterium]|nr:Fe-S cluster assembly protein SufD [Gammaproteobacteria bacterium]